MGKLKVLGILFVNFGFAANSMATKIIGQAENSESNSCSYCHIIIIGKPNAGKEVILHQTYTDSNGEFSFNTSYRNSIEIYARSTTNKTDMSFTSVSRNSLKQNSIVLHKPIKLENKKLARAFKIKSILVSSKFKEVNISGSSSAQEFNVDFSNLPVETKTIDVAFLVAPEKIEAKYKSIHTSKHPSVKTSIYFQENASTSEVNLSQYSLCYQAMTSAKSLNQPQTFSDFSKVTEESHVVFQNVDGEILLLRDDEVYSYGHQQKVTNISFSEEFSTSASQDIAPVLMYPPGKNSKKLYLIDSSSHDLKFSLTPDGHYGTKWSQVNKTEQSQDIDSKFKKDFISKRAQDLKLIYKHAEKHLAELHLVAPEKFTTATNEIKKIHNECSILARDRDIAEEVVSYQWTSALINLEKTLINTSNTPNSESHLSIATRN